VHPAKGEADDHRCDDGVGPGSKIEHSKPIALPDKPSQPDVQAPAPAAASGGPGSQNISLSDVVDPDNRMRELRSEVIEQLSASIRERGLLQPIVLSPFGSRFKLVAGRHRLEAVKRLGGHLTIKAVVLDDIDADQALLVEIDENLIRADLSPAERALHLAKRKELYEKVHPETKRGVAGGKVRQGAASVTLSFAESTAKATHKSKRTVQREVARGKIADVADAVGTSLDAPDELDALAKLPESVQRDLIAQAKNGTRVTAKASKAEGAKQSNKSVAPKDVALFAFNERVLDLLQRISKHRPDRFAKSSVGADDLANLGKFFADLAQLKARAAP
jgi:ParB-like chromosome segregation protein Spo0J